MNWLSILLLFSILLAIQQFSLLLAVQIDLALLINNLWQFNQLEIYKALFVSFNFYPHPYNISQKTWLNTWLRGSSQVSAAFPSVPPWYLGQWVTTGLLCRVSLLVNQCCFQWLPPPLWKCFSTLYLIKLKNFSGGWHKLLNDHFKPFFLIFSCVGKSGHLPVSKCFAPRLFSLKLKWFCHHICTFF